MKKDEKTGKFIKSAVYLIMECQYCGISFESKETKVARGGGKYCSRTCADAHKKITYKGELNPMFGKHLTDEHKMKLSESSKNLWKDPIWVNKVKKSVNEFIIRSKSTGTWDDMQQKRVHKMMLTMISRYGHHNLSGEYGNRQCDTTFQEKYGMSSHEYRNLHNKTKRNTKIERIVQEILQKNNISYVSHHRLDNYEFDIYLPELNILIECDGDYWHGKNLDDSELNESQSNTRKNDNIKNYIAVVNKIKLLRFWESDIKNTNFDEILLKTIWER